MNKSNASKLKNISIDKILNFYVDKNSNLKTSKQNNTHQKIFNLGEEMKTIAIAKANKAIYTIIPVSL
jgi:hypothetical protein